MAEQIPIVQGDNTPASNENLYLNSLMPRLREAVTSLGCDANQIKLNNTLAYSVVMLSSFTVFRLHIRGSQHYIDFPGIFSDLVRDNSALKPSKSDPKYLRLLIDDDHPVEQYSDFLIAITKESVNRYPKDWDCCSRYLSCSQAKKCVHPNSTFALGCGYRKILHRGEVFYGENRNVD